MDFLFSKNALGSASEAGSGTTNSRERPFSISEISRQINALLQGEFSRIWVRGEITNLRFQSSGHVYFTLKDENSQLSATIWKSTAQNLKIRLRDGMLLVAFGKISVYEKQGKYQIVISAAFEEGVGALMAEFERLKTKLAAEGIFEKSKHKKIPKIARKIAFVTSPTGAAIRDFISVLKRRNWSGTLFVVPAKVQGEGSAKEIAAQIKVAEKIRNLDLLVVGRGGGSLEDLWSFNEEIVARTIHAAKVPIISAVGHEIDFSLSDFAADVRAETPTAAAELISSNFLEMKERFENAAGTLEEIAAGTLNELTQNLDSLENQLEIYSPKKLLEISRERLKSLEKALFAAAVPELSSKREQFLELSARLKKLSPEHEINFAKMKIEQLASRLKASGIEATLKRGFALAVDTGTQKIIDSADKISLGSDVTLRFHDGNAHVQGLDLR